jgi:glucose-1-phosphate adenylyltransferase
VLESLQVFAYAFQDVRTRAQAYWRDVGTLDAFYEANMELVYVNPELNIYDEEWPIWTYQLQRPPAKFVLDDEGRRGMAVNSMVAGGSIISGALVRESLLFSDVRVEERSTVQASVLLPNVTVGRGCVVQRAIIDEGCEIPDGTRIGVDLAADAKRFEVTERGVVLVTPEMLREPG